MVFMYAGDKVPDNYMLCDGRELSKAEYPQLFQAIGTIYGESVDRLSFKIPDLRGCFTRCVGGNAAPLGIKQSDAIRNIVSSFSYALATTNGFEGAFSKSTSRNIAVSYIWGGAEKLVQLNFNASSVVPTAEENRPINMSMNFIIQVKE